MSEVILKVKIETKDPNKQLPNTGEYWANDLLFTLEELFDNSELKDQVKVSVDTITSKSNCPSCRGENRKLAYQCPDNWHN